MPDIQRWLSDRSISDETVLEEVNEYLDEIMGDNPTITAKIITAEKFWI